jgi:hypothetical protein
MKHVLDAVDRDGLRFSTTFTIPLTRRICCERLARRAPSHRLKTSQATGSLSHAAPDPDGPTRTRPQG